MAQRSRYDELHDRYQAALISKAGTRYERLAALVFKILESQNVVIHDLKLVGDSTVAHQIDVSIEVNGTPRRVLIECKDFDVSGARVDLDILRSFRSVIEEIPGAEGIVVTCNGYTREAQKYAKAKGIKLAVLRRATEADLEGLIRKVIVQMHVQSHHNHSTTVCMNEASRDIFQAELSGIETTHGITILDPVYVVGEGSKVQFTKFLSDEVNKQKPEHGADGRWVIKTPSQGRALQVEDGPLISFDGFITTYDIMTETFPIEVTSNQIAELIVSGLGPDDIIIFDDQIKRLKIDEATGEIIDSAATP